MLRSSLIASLLVGWACAAAAEDRYVSYSGVATEKHSTKFLYGERHVLRYHEGRMAERVVLYTCRDGAAFARKTVAYVDALAPDFLLDDVSNGMRQGVRTAGGIRSVFYRGDRLQNEKSAVLPQRPGLVADAGFDEFIRSNWQPLMAGKTLPLNFLVPSRLHDMGFHVQRLRSERRDGAAAEVFRLKLSGVLGWVLPGIDVYYSAGDHLLVRYEGLSDLQDAAHENYQTQIVFLPSDRKAANQRLMDSARRAPLASCG